MRPMQLAVEQHVVHGDVLVPERARRRARGTRCRTAARSRRAARRAPGRSRSSGAPAGRRRRSSRGGRAPRSSASRRGSARSRRVGRGAAARSSTSRSRRPGASATAASWSTKSRIALPRADHLDLGVVVGPAVVAEQAGLFGAQVEHLGRAPASFAGHARLSEAADQLAAQLGVAAERDDRDRGPGSRWSASTSPSSPAGCAATEVLRAARPAARDGRGSVRASSRIARPKSCSSSTSRSAISRSRCDRRRRRGRRRCAGSRAARARAAARRRVVGGVGAVAAIDVVEVAVEVAVGVDAG